MNKIKLAVIALFAGASLQANAQQGVKFDPNYKGYYVLKTVFRGNGEGLECNGAESPTMNGAAFMSSQPGPPTGQQWKFVPVGGGWYKMQTRLHGDKKCFEGNAMNGSAKNGAAFMDNCQNVSGQLWKLEEIKGKPNVYRLKTQFQGENHSLEGNKVGGSRGGNAFMDKTQDVSGQMWYLVPVK